MKLAPRARAQPVSVPAEFFDHPLLIDFLFDRVVQDMAPDKTTHQMVELHRSTSCDQVSIIDERYREPIMSPSVLSSTSAEVLTGLTKAFDDYEKKNEAAWRKA